MEDIPEVCDTYVSDSCLWQSYYPFKDQRGGQHVARHFWVPFKNSFKRVQRRQDIFFAGKNELSEDDTVWVVSMGHLMGLFDEDWLSIRANGKMTFLRYVEFNELKNDKIVQTAFYFDLPNLMNQVGHISCTNGLEYLEHYCADG